MAPKRPGGRQRRETVRRARERRKRTQVTAALLVAIVALTTGLLVLSGGTSDRQGSNRATPPEFTLAEFGGGQSALSDFLGRPLAVTFMHTW